MKNNENKILPFFIEFHFSQENTDRIVSCLVKETGLIVKDIEKGIYLAVVLKNGEKVPEEYFHSFVNSYLSEMMEYGYSTERCVELLCSDPSEQKALLEDIAANYGEYVKQSI